MWLVRLGGGVLVRGCSGEPCKVRAEQAPGCVGERKYRIGIYVPQLPSCSEHGARRSSGGCRARAQVAASLAGLPPNSLSYTRIHCEWADYYTEITRGAWDEAAS